MNNLISPYGNQLVNLLDQSQDKNKLFEFAKTLLSIELSFEDLCNFELLVTGAFSPLNRFMGEKDYKQVLKENRLTNGMFFPFPIVLPVTFRNDFSLNNNIVLKDPAGTILAIMRLSEVFDLQNVEKNKVGITGPLSVLQLPRHFDFEELRLTPFQTRSILNQMNCKGVIAFQTNDFIFRFHEELMKGARDKIESALLIHSAMQPDDFDYYERVQSHKVLVKEYYDPKRTLLDLIPFVMKGSGIQEILLRAIISRNYGANYLLVENVSTDLKKHELELGIKIISSNEMVYIPTEDRYVEKDLVPKTTRVFSFSSMQEQDKNQFIRSKIYKLYSNSTNNKKGICIWIMGLPKAGKTTVAKYIQGLLKEQEKSISLLDETEIGLRFSKSSAYRNKADRLIIANIIDCIASELINRKEVVICTSTDAYPLIWERIKLTIGEKNFVIVFLDIPIKICEQRDTVNIYAEARKGTLNDFPGVNFPYSKPEGNVGIWIKTDQYDSKEIAKLVLQYLVNQNLLKENVNGN